MEFSFQPHPDLIGNIYDEQVYTNGEAFTGGETFTNGEAGPEEGFPPNTSVPPGLYGQPTETQSILADGGHSFGVSAVAFDQQEELVWMGNQGGHVTSYYGLDMQKYTSFQVHATDEIHSIQSCDNGILALSQNTLRFQMRRGIPIFTHSSENMKEMRCQLLMSPDNLLLGGTNTGVIQFNLERGQETQLHGEVGDGRCGILRRCSRFVCSGSPEGTLSLLDPVSLKVIHNLDAHSGGLSDLDVHGNLIVTCGVTNRMGTLTMDRLLTVYDIRILRPVSPLQVLVDPFILRFLPTADSMLSVVSPLGHMQILDTASVENPEVYLYQVNTAGALCLAYDVCSTSQAMTFGDAGGYLHLFSTGPAQEQEPYFNPYSRATEFADPIEELPHIPWDDDITPLSIIPMPISQTAEPLFSNIPQQFCHKLYRRTPKIDSDILRSMMLVQSIGYAPNPGKKRRNQVPYKLDKKNRSRKPSIPESPVGGAGNMFATIPARYHRVEMKYGRLGLDEFDFDQYNRTSFTGLEPNLPNSYCSSLLFVFYYLEPVRCSMMSHLCSREFCLACELGLLFHMMDISQGFPCQSNNFIRAFKTIPEASRLGLILNDEPDTMKNINYPRLIQSWCRFVLQQVHSEMASLKEKQRQSSKESSPTKSRSQSQEPTSSDTGEENTDTDNTDTAAVVEETAEFEEVSALDSSHVSQLFGMMTSTTNTFRCKNTHCKDSVPLMCNLTYQHAHEESPPQQSFTGILEESLSFTLTSRGWCDVCKKFQTAEQQRNVKTLPNVLVLNCGMDNPQNLEYWKKQSAMLAASVEARRKVNAANASSGRSTTPVSMLATKPCRYGASCNRPDCKFWHDNLTLDSKESNSVFTSWMPMGMFAKLQDDGKVHLDSLNTDQVDRHPQKDEDGWDTCVYELSSVVSYINNGVENSCVVAACKVGGAHHERAMGSHVAQWYLFNDISITPVSAEEAVWFNCGWKVPCVLVYTRYNLAEKALVRGDNPITRAVFQEDTSLSQHSSQLHIQITFMPLAQDEFPQAGELIAMDAEFVTLSQEVADLTSDGQSTMIKPSQKSVGRVTCLRGQGALEGIPFIDDYISTQEQVVDYMTKFSGIHPGDLDAAVSSKHLTTLKSTYLKLRYLIDRDVVFVGHGLKNDFRVMNIVVPPDQMIDTVFLFQLPHQRLVALRFLAWHFLGIKIQSSLHDSIEDARTALQLYRKYQELDAAGCVQSALMELYDTGRSMGWKIPGEGTDD